jgi:iron(III) transport system substrate-binding protein
LSSVRVIKNALVVFLVLCLAFTLSACGGGKTEQASGSGEKQGEKKQEDKKLVIYTGRDKNLVDAVIPKFKEKNPGYDVQVVTMGAQEILERVRGEKNNPQADFWWGAPQSTLMTAADEGLLESYRPTFADKIADQYKDSQNRWIGEMLLPEVIMYNSQALKKEDAPKDWDDLIDAKYKGKIIIRGVMASGTMRTIYSSMIFRQDPNNPQKGYDWLKKLDANTKEYAQNPTNLYLKLARQEGTLSLWNLQDIMIQKEKKKQPFDYIYPQSGAPILVDGVGIVKGAKNQEAAKKFYEFLFDPQTAVELSKEYYQIPTRSDIPKDQLPAWISGLNVKPLDLDWKKMSEKEKEWMQYWDENIRGKGAK